MKTIAHILAIGGSLRLADVITLAVFGIHVEPAVFNAVFMWVLALVLLAVGQVYHWVIIGISAERQAKRNARIGPCGDAETASVVQRGS